ncbi:MAG: DNA-3-methyladenine glycosylase I [Rhodocyclaceae bacterium]|nr:DNA-3-methyladenine glycosylase I [Rhodocyclaceae bacterium]
MTRSTLDQLPNIGPRSAAWLATVGIRDVATLRRLGVAEALRRLLAAGHSPSMNLAYALHAGLAGRHWQSLDADERGALIMMVDGLRRERTASPSRDTGRCGWCGDDPLYMRYHDEEWGVPVHDDRRLFEFVVLEGAQAGLSWLTVLRKRDGYRRAFADFDPAAVAAFTEADVAALLGDAGIVRNRAKILSTVGNARAFLELQARHGSFDRFVWDFVDGRPRINHWHSLSEMPATTPESDALSKALKAAGFKFVGSTICYAHMQATGMVNDHLVSCFRHAELAGGR